MTFYVSTAPSYLARRWTVRSAEQETPRALPVDIREQEEAYLLTAFVPGLSAADLNIQVLEDAVSIAGAYSQYEGQALLSELPAGSFQRSLRLPTALDAENAEAQIENGILTLRIPKAESARPRVIKVASK